MPEEKSDKKSKVDGRSHFPAQQLPHRADEGDVEEQSFVDAVRVPHPGRHFARKGSTAENRCDLRMDDDKVDQDYPLPQ